MKIYTRAYDAALGQVKMTEQEIEVIFKSSVNTMADLPTDDAENTVRYAYDINHLYCYKNGTWHDQGTFDFSDALIEKLTQGLS